MSWTERFAEGAVLSFFAGLLYVAHQHPRPVTTWSIEVAEAAPHPTAFAPTFPFTYRGEDEPVVVAVPGVVPYPEAGRLAEPARGGSEATRPAAGQGRQSANPQRLGIYSLTEATPEMRALRRYLARRYDTAEQQLTRWLKTVETEARRYGIDPLLVVAIIAVESGFDPAQQSSQGAIGLMQVIPKWHLDKIDARVDGDPEPDHLFDPKINIAVGVEVLAEGLARYRQLERALQYYNGSLNDRERRYSKKVLSVYRQLQRIAGVTLENGGAGKVASR